MSRKKEKAVDTEELSTVSPEEADESQETVEESSVSQKLPKKEEPPKVIRLDDIDAFDPSATHEDLSEDDNFDDEDESY